MPTFGTHTPDVPYQPSSEMAWGPRGSEHMKSGADREYEERVKATPTSYHWTNSDIHLDGNYEVRLREEDSTFTPNVGNLAPRPEGWKSKNYQNYGAK